MKRSVILFPKFNNIDAIKSIREKYDPLTNCIAPHITIVFPFESNMSTIKLKEHFNEALEGIKKFNVQLKGITGDFRDGYLFLNVKKGNDQVIELHDRLYSGILQSFLYKKITYCPHLTLVRVKEQIDFENVVNQLSCFNEIFETVIDKVFVESIDIDEKSNIELLFDLE